MTTKLDPGQQHFLRLIEKGQACPDGWAPVSAAVYPLVQGLPPELIEHAPVGDEGRGRARLSAQGHAVLDAMAYL